MLLGYYGTLEQQQLSAGAFLSQTSYPMHGITYATSDQIPLSPLGNNSTSHLLAVSPPGGPEGGGSEGGGGGGGGQNEDFMRVVVKLLNYPLFMCAMVLNIPLLVLIVFEKSLHKAPFFLIANKSVINTMSAVTIFYQCLR